MRPGERLLIRCEGGPSVSRLVHYPPPLEIEEGTGIYVLDEGYDNEDWVYVWITDDS